MKLVHKEISEKSKDTSGSVTLIPEEMEDMWHIYNLIAVGDYVRASTIRQARFIMLKYLKDFKIFRSQN